jgi:hypothetical protein
MAKPLTLIWLCGRLAVASVVALYQPAFAGESTGSLVVLVDFSAMHRVAIDVCQPKFAVNVKQMQRAFDIWQLSHGKAQQRLLDGMIHESDSPSDLKAALAGIRSSSLDGYRKQLDAHTPSQREAFCKSEYVASLQNKSIQFADWPEANKKQLF